MNIQAYIESGILEEYVLGTVSPQEKQEVECMSHIYPEIKEELLRTEDALEQYALKYQTAPPASLKESLFAQMRFDEVDEDSNEAATVLLSDSTENKLVEEKVVAPEDSNVITDVFDRVETREVTPFWAKLAIAASVLLALFAGWSAMQVNDLKKGNRELASKIENSNFELETAKKNNEYNEALASLYRNPDYKVIHMAGIPTKSPESSVAAFWNTQTNEVLLDVQKLPEAPAGKQYQLWSIVDGVPVDIGMLDAKFTGKVLKMKPTKAGSVAFAITLEKTGGNPTPTMEEMFVMGKV